MADRTIKPDDTNDLVLQNNDGSAKIEVNEAQTVVLTGGSSTTATITSGGDVMIDDSATLFVKGTGTTADRLTLENSGGSGKASIKNSSGTDTIVLTGADGKVQCDEVRANNGDGLKLYDDGGNGIFVEDGGDVGFNTTSPTSPITIAQSADSIAFDFYGYDDVSGNKGSLSVNSIGYTQLKSHGDRSIDLISGDSGLGGQMRFYSGSNLRLTIAADGTFTGSSSNDISDQRLKENINPISNAFT